MTTTTILHRSTHAVIHSGGGSIREVLEDGIRRGISFEGANLWGADLRGADLRGADLRKADLEYASLWGADLAGADLRDAEIRSTNLEDADLTDIDIGLELPDPIELRRRVRFQIESHPENWEQAEWHSKCGTKHCVAGWTVVLAGDIGTRLEKRWGPSSAAHILLGGKTRPSFEADATLDDVLAGWGTGGLGAGS